MRPGGHGSKTVLPSRAVVTVDFRLVQRQDPYVVFEQLRAHIDGLGMDGGGVRLLGAIPSSYAPLDSEIARAVTVMAAFALSLKM